MRLELVTYMKRIPTVTVRGANATGTQLARDPLQETSHL